MPIPEVYADETLGAGEVIVTEFLSPGQNILGQPPYEWVQLDDNLIPNDFFQKDEGAVLLFRIIGSAPNALQWAGFDIIHRGFSRFRDLVSPEYSDPEDGTVVYFLNMISNYLRNNYPYSLEYLHRYWISRHEFRADGSPLNKQVQIPSYAAFAWQQTYLAGQQRLVGLDKVIPSTYASASEITKAIPPKSPVNRYFRLRRSEALG